MMRLWGRMKGEPVGERRDTLILTLQESTFMRLPEGERAAAIRHLFQEVAGTPQGLQAFTILLMDLYYFREAADEEAVALKNYATRFLRERLGVTDPLLQTSLILSSSRKGEAR